MAAKTPARSVHATLSTTVADSITWTSGGPYNTIAVTNRDASAVLYFRTDGVTAVAAADGTYVVLATQTKVVSVQNAGAAAVLSVVGNGNAYSVEGL